MLMLKPVPTTLAIFALIVCLAFPPLLLIPAGIVVVVLVRKRREYTDPQSVAWRAQQDWYKQNG